MIADLPHGPRGEDWWIALVSFERGQGDQDIIPDHCEGAVGWMAALAANGEELAHRIRRSLREIGLHASEIDEERLVYSLADIRDVDEHLAQNVANLEPSKTVVWGTIHCYVAQGEA